MEKNNVAKMTQVQIKTDKRILIFSTILPYPFNRTNYLASDTLLIDIREHRTITSFRSEGLCMCML